MRNQFRVGLLMAAAVFSCGMWAGDVQGQENRLFELRIYTAHPGKLEALHKRFRDHTNKIFQRHGMQLIGYWTPTDGEEAQNTLVYVLAYPNQEAREAAWKAFRDDPEWQKAYEQSHRDGPLVMKVESKIMNPTDYSPIK